MFDENDSEILRKATQRKDVKEEASLREEWTDEDLYQHSPPMDALPWLSVRTVFVSWITAHHIYIYIRILF
jgi:hypothetical protein